MVWLVYWSDTSRNLTASAVIRTARASELLVRLGMPTKLTEVASGGGFPGGRSVRLCLVSLTSNLVGNGGLRIYVRTVPICGISFLGFGPQHPQAGAGFWPEASYSKQS